MMDKLQLSGDPDGGDARHRIIVEIGTIQAGSSPADWVNQVTTRRMWAKNRYKPPLQSWLGDSAISQNFCRFLVQSSPPLGDAKEKTQGSPGFFRFWC